MMSLHRAMTGTGRFEGAVLIMKRHMWMTDHSPQVGSSPQHELPCLAAKTCCLAVTVTVAHVLSDAG
jgi:hypothetical protein